jgi:hypothetical protein
MTNDLKEDNYKTTLYHTIFHRYAPVRPSEVVWQGVWWWEWVRG